MRILIILLLSLLWMSPVQAADEWTAWLREGRDVIFRVDSEGNELQRITLPVAENQSIHSRGVSHNGNLIAYVSINSEYDASQLRVYDTQTLQLRVVFDLGLTARTNFSSLLTRSHNFNLEDTKLAFAYQNDPEANWRILVFDLESGIVEQMLTSEEAEDTLMRVNTGQPVILHFADGIINFIAVMPYNSPYGPDTALRSSLEWNISTDTVAENCAYTHFDYATFDPTGEVIQSGIDFSFYTLEIYNADTNLRQAFYQTHDFIPSNPLFIQNGERIIFWGNPEPEVSLRHYRFVVIERDGAVVDQLDFDGSPIVRALNDGFIYITWVDETEWISRLIYVNTRQEDPFTSQSTILESQPEAYWQLLWAGNDVVAPLPTFTPWGELVIYSIDCPPYRG